MKLTEAAIDAMAPNQNAIQNAWSLVKNKSLIALGQAEDGAVIFGECLGSGEANYRLSADFADPANPILRCSCPSRQFPCKHLLALLYAHASGRPFAAASLPAEALAAREKAREKAERKAKRLEKTAEPAAPKKVNLAALGKKNRTQLEGLDLLDKILENIVRTGLGTQDAQSLQILAEQARQLGDYYLPGPQDALKEYIHLCRAAAADPEKTYSAALDRLARLSATSRRGREYLAKKQADPAGFVDQDSVLEELLGHAWQLDELRALGRVRRDAELIQLSFTSYDDPARGEYIDLGLWLDLAGGGIWRSLNYRPYRAAKHLREDDSCFEVAVIRELCVYPGDLNPRVRWEEAAYRPPSAADYRAVCAHAAASLKQAIQQVKNQLKNPLADRHPVLLLGYARLGLIDGAPVIEDADGERLGLANLPGGPEPPTVHLLPLLEERELYNGAMLARFHHDLAAGLLRAQPLALAGADGIRRLAY
ncbi:MAG: SWIM zinc finger family protein [Bacteroidota bacterium]